MSLGPQSRDPTYPRTYPQLQKCLSYKCSSRAAMDIEEPPPPTFSASPGSSDSPQETVLLMRQKLDQEITAGQVARDNKDAGPDHAVMDIDHAGLGDAAVDIGNTAEVEVWAQDSGQAVAVSSHMLPDPDSDADSEVTVDKEPADGPDQDPPSEELPNQPTNSNFDPIYKPDMGDTQIHEIMRLELSNLAEDEWLELCE
ncbi:hypothetical protein BDV93DRAFT_571915 [Ceratobasidium sp. AG-I]|nr:hypothetical protein BDV93DRAFT_571915 [Ceratobasidium sp. AG-I]